MADKTTKNPQNQQPTGLGQQASQLIVNATQGGRALSPQQEQEIYNRLLGNIQDQVFVPPGAQIIESGGARLVYRDAEGFTHSFTRNQNGNDPNFGQLSPEQTDRPAVLPNQQANDLLSQLISGTSQYAKDPNALAQIDPTTQAWLDQISSTERMAQDEQFKRQSDDLLTRLFGRRLNQSSIGNQAGSDLLQGQGLVAATQQSNDAARRLGVSEFLTNTGAQKNQSLMALLNSLSGRQSNEGIANAGFGLDADRLAEQIRANNQQYALGNRGIDIQQQGLDAENSFFNKFLKSIQAGAAVASGVGAAAGGFKA